MSIIIKSGSSGNLANVTAAGAMQIDGSAVTQPISVVLQTVTGALGSLNATVQIAATGLGIGMQLDAGTLIGTIVPEVSFDGGTTWNPAQFFNFNDSYVPNFLFVGTNGATASVIDGVTGITHARIRVSVYVSGTANVHLSTSGMARGHHIVATVDGPKVTYSAAARAIVPAASATSPTFSIQGTATKTIRITRIRFSCSATTGQALPTSVSLQRFSVLSGGVSVLLTTSRNDINDGIATATVNNWTTVPSTAITVGGVHATERFDTTTAGATVAQPNMKVEFTFGLHPGTREFVLRGTGDYLGLILAVAGTTPVADIFVEWTEE